MQDYVDVFISHKQEDSTEATRLQSQVVSLGYSCYLDAADSRLVNNGASGDIAEHIRSSLRRSKCLMYLYSPRSIRSKWMPWELGFFDGRWGAKNIGLFVADEMEVLHRVAKSNHSRKRKSVRSLPSFSIQEYLSMYEHVTDRSLPEFLRRATSMETLANRSEVDVDRFMTLAASAIQNPVAFNLGCIQYVLGTLRPMSKVNPFLSAQLDGVLGGLIAMRSSSEAAAAPLVKVNAAPWIAPSPFLEIFRQSLDHGAIASTAGMDDYKRNLPAGVASNRPINGYSDVAFVGAAKKKMMSQGKNK